MKKNQILFILITIIAFLLRFYQLGAIPTSLDWDEVSNAYNAYSILKTGRDEYGNFLPLTNRSFDDYKPPLYMYLEIPSVAIFGLTPFAARLPSAIFGFLTVPLIYLLTKWIFKDKKDNDSDKISLLAMFLMAISPWSIQFSRVGFEANVGLFFSLLAVTSALYGLKKNWLLLISAISVGFSLYSYHSQKLFIPSIFLLLIIIFRREIFSIPRKFIYSFTIISLIIILPMFTLIPNKALFNRFESTSQQSYINEVNTSIDFINTDKNSHIPFSNIIHNRRIIISQSMLESYLKHFDINFLFLTGDDNPRHHVDNMGMLYLFELPLILIGLYKIISKPSKEYFFLVLWLLIAPIPASLSNTAPHAIRSYLMVIPLEVMSALGLITIFQAAGKFKSLARYLASLIILFSLATYLENYYFHYAYDRATSWQYPYEQAVYLSQKYANNGSKVYVSPTIDQAYIFWLFYTKYNPRAYQVSGTKTHFGNYYFFSNEPTNIGDIYVSTSLNNSFATLNTLNDPTNKNVVLIGERK